MFYYFQTTDTETFYGVTAQVYGWGNSTAQSTEDVVAWSNILQETNLTVPHPDVCKAAGDIFCSNETNAQEFPETCGMWQFMDSIPPGLLCAGSPGKGACMVSFHLSPLTFKLYVFWYSPG